MVESVCFWHVLRVVAPLVRACVCVFQQQQAVSYPLTPRCPSSAVQELSAREVPSTDCLELIGTCEKSQRLKGGNSHTLDPAAHPMSPRRMRGNVGNREGATHLYLTKSDGY